MKRNPHENKVLGDPARNRCCLCGKSAERLAETDGRLIRGGEGAVRAHCVDLAHGILHSPDEQLAVARQRAANEQSKTLLSRLFGKW